MKAKKSYYIDFSSWTLLAKTETEAYDKAIKYLKSGRIPAICSVEETFEKVTKETTDEIDVLKERK